MAPKIFALLAFSIAATTVVASCNSPESLLESKSCLLGEYEKLEARLNYKYQEILKSLGKSADGYYDTAEIRKAVISAQKTWLLFREKNCNIYVVLNKNGNNGSQEELQCKIEITKLRIQDLDNFNLDARS
ncbi:lysozyme inhibitor LprI family protein [Jeongeupia chitinilytica]|uniref:Lysozyme inhibitor LprI-like N-terminal domain-containing protein n=1 Tax=Jeongeupia chitinilytica TaxID=1041641 RepID=A0ABQ3GY94_9NEIS|nr:lysozyme inhibitor LprI family protein [Jeongeupia chitinilytica]GHD57115.1 hypothetical protein GCM10007350_05310 [Jeongeupia chitinilytica]